MIPLIYSHSAMLNMLFVSLLVVLILSLAMTCSSFARNSHTSSKTHQSVITSRKSHHFHRFLHYPRAFELYDSSSSEAVPEKPASPAKKGFGKVPEPAPVKEAEVDAGTKTYEMQAKRGVPEYNIFIRPANGSETDWIPVGSMTIPR
jgi:hypothetical protein